MAAARGRSRGKPERAVMPQLISKNPWTQTGVPAGSRASRPRKNRKNPQITAQDRMAPRTAPVKAGIGSANVCEVVEELCCKVISLVSKNPQSREAIQWIASKNSPVFTESKTASPAVFSKNPGPQQAQKPSSQHNFYAMYTGNRSNGLLLAEKFRAMGYDVPEEKIINVGAAIGSHVGPNACGMVYVKE